MNTTNNAELVVKKNNSLTQSSATPSERFTMAVMKNFSQENGEVQITPFQKRLCQSYFIKIDQMLKASELKRMAKSEQYRDNLAYSWENVNMNKLAVDVISYSSVGLDPMQKNHLHPIPYKNSALNKYDIQFTLGYNGLELKAKKYGFDVPDKVVIKVVYSKEAFAPIYKDFDNEVESFTHKPSENPFDKGEITGGYYYYQYLSEPEKNQLRVFSIEDIKKRIPKTASVEFWGGEKDKWENGKKSGKEQIDGWFDEMVWKTIKRAAYDAIPIDSEKIDAYIQDVLLQSEFTEKLIENNETVEDKVQHEIKTEANKETLNFDNVEEAEVESEEVLETETQEIPKDKGF